MIKKIFKANWQHILAIAIFAAIVLIKFSPALDGYTVKQGDITSYAGMAKEIRDFRALNNGEESIWTNAMFGGMPGYQMDVKYDNGIINLHKVMKLGLPYPFSHFIVSLLCFYFLGRVLKMNYLLAILGALMYAFVTYNFLIVEAGHNTKLLTIAYFPGLLASFLYVFRARNRLLSLAIFSAFTALILFANHAQMTYYFIFVLFAIGISEFYTHIKNKELPRFAKSVGILLLGGMIALATNIGNYYDTLNFSKHTMRGGSELSIKPPSNQVAMETTDKNEKTKKRKGLDPAYIVHWSYGKQETYNLFVPNAKGSNALAQDMFTELGKTNRNLPATVYKKYQQSGGKAFGGYWGDQPGTSGPNYIGAISVFLALLYLLLIHNPLKWALFGVTFLVILLSWGSNLGGSVENMWLTNFFIDNVPMYNKFRAVSSMLTIVSFTVPLMAILFLKEIMTNKEWAKKNMKKILITGGSITVIVLFLGFAPNMFNFTNDIENKILTETVASNGVDSAMIKSGIEDFRKSVFKADSLRTVGFIAITLLLLFLGITDKIKYKFILPILSVLVLVDLIGVSNRFFNNEKVEGKPLEYKNWHKNDGFVNTPRPTKGEMAIYQMESQLNPEIQKQAKARIQQRSIEKKGKMLAQDQEAIMFSSLYLNTHYRVLDLDNPFNSSRASYFNKSTGGYHPAKLSRYQDMISFYISPEINLLSTGAMDKMKVLNMLNNKYYLYKNDLLGGRPNPYAMGNAWFVQNIKSVKGADEEILAIKETDVKTTAIVEESFANLVNGKTFEKDSTATIKLTNYQPNHLVYESNSSKEQLAIFSEIYYEDGWNAYIDNNKTEHLRANYILRGLVIPAGKHTIQFKFEPAAYAINNKIGLFSFLLIIGTLGWFLFQYIKNKGWENQLESSEIKLDNETLKA